MCKVDTMYISKTVIPKLVFLINFQISGCISDDLPTRDGSLLGLSECIIALNDINDIFKILEADIIKQIQDLLPNYPLTYLQNFGSDITLCSCLNLVHALAYVNFESSTETWEMVKVGLERKEDFVYNSATKALTKLSLIDEVGGQNLLDSYLLNDTKLSSLLIGGLDKKLMIKNLKIIVDKLGGIVRNVKIIL